MAIIFNSGTNKELIVNEYAAGSYLTGEYSRWYNTCYWFYGTRSAIKPFNLSPFLVDYVADNTKNLITLIKTGTNSYIGIHITSTTVSLHVNECTIVNGVISHEGPRIYECLINAASYPANVYFCYTNASDTSNRCILSIFWGDAKEVTFEVGTTDQGRTGIIGTEGTLKDIGQYICYPTIPPRPYSSDGNFCQNSSLYSYMPVIAWMFPVNSDNISSYSFDDLSGLQNVDGTSPEPYTPESPDPLDPFEPSEPDPYPVDPPAPDTSDLIPIPNNPVIGVTNAGFINIYSPAIGALQGLGDILFPNVASATDIVDAVLKLCETLANQNLINYVIDCHVIPVTPQLGSNSTIKVGFRDTGISVPVVTNDYVDATCGSLNIPEHFNGYQDYVCTRSKIYLPFIGFVDTKPEYWQAGTISVDYKFNVIDGSFMCYIRSISSKSALNGSVIAQYAGNACMHFPLTGVNYSNMVSGLVGAAIAAASGGTSSAVLGSALSAANTIAQGGDVQQSNGYNSTAALMGIRTPYLLIERPVPAFPSGYGHNKGYPTNFTTILSGVRGFTTIEDIELSGIPFTSDELSELRQLLADGVYF